MSDHGYSDDRMVSLYIPGQPVPKGRPRITTPNRKPLPHELAQLNGVPPRITSFTDLPRGRWAPTWSAVASMCVLALSLLILAATIVVCWGRP